MAGYSPVYQRGVSFILTLGFKGSLEHQGSFRGAGREGSDPVPCHSTLDSKDTSFHFPRALRMRKGPAEVKWGIEVGTKASHKIPKILLHLAANHEKAPVILTVTKQRQKSHQIYFKISCFAVLSQIYKSLGSLLQNVSSICNAHF